VGNSLYCEDNLTALSRVPAGSVKVAYADPPFNSGSDWFRPDGNGGQALAFTDKWAWGEDAAQQYKEACAASRATAGCMEWFRGILGETGALAYLSHMALRFPGLHRVLTPDGALFLHVDQAMCHYLKILLDCVFGEDGFAGEIIWKRTSAHKASRGFGRIHDNILVYLRSPAGRISLGEDGNLWLDIAPARRKERTGWPTQKPQPLLDRIIAVSGARPGDMLLDPNCGGGTALAAAHRAGLAWTGIDLSADAIGLCQARLRAAGATFDVTGAALLPPPETTLF
jgi:site-specific DNA-methyltransferase (adenine-specific)